MAGGRRCDAAWSVQAKNDALNNEVLRPPPLPAATARTLGRALGRARTDCCRSRALPERRATPMRRSAAATAQIRALRERARHSDESLKQLSSLAKQSSSVIQVGVSGRGLSGRGLTASGMRFSDTVIDGPVLMVLWKYPPGEYTMSPGSW